MNIWLKSERAYIISTHFVVFVFKKNANPEIYGK